jgi:hypothetical protein
MSPGRTLLFGEPVPIARGRACGPHLKNTDPGKLDRLIAEQRRLQDERALGYRERALKIYPWICGRCAREFTHRNLRELTVHHRDHNHENNPPDGSNWELLCLYCHDNEHQRQLEAATGTASAGADVRTSSTHSPFAGLKGLLAGRVDPE